MNEQLWLFSLTLAVLPIGLTAKVAQAASLNVLPINQKAFLAKPIQVQVQISNLEPSSLSGFDLELNFNPSILQFTNISFGDSRLGDLVNLSNEFGLTSFSNVEPGIVKFSEISLDDAEALNAAQPTNFTLATLSFNAIQTGTNEFNLTVNELADENTVSFTLDNPPTSAKVSVKPVPEPTSIFTTTAVLGLMAFYKLNLSNKQNKKKHN